MTIQQTELEAQGTALRVRATVPVTIATYGRTGTTVTVTLTAHGESAGDRIEVTTPGIAGAYTITTATENTFTFETEASGTVAPGAELVFYHLLDIDPKTFSGPGGSATVIDATTLGSKAKRKRMGLRDEGQLSFTVHYVPGNPAHEALRTARRNRAPVQIELAFTDSPTTYWSFTGYVLAFPVGGSVDGIIESNVTLEISGEILEY